MQVNDYLLRVCSRKPLYQTAKGAFLVNKDQLMILQENDVPRICEMVRVLVETIERIASISLDDSDEHLLAVSISAHIQDLIDQDPFVNEPGDTQ